MIALAAFSLLAGCTANGDFGEVRPTLVSDGIHDWVGQPTSSFEFTDDERQLRDLAYPLIEAPYDRQQWYSVAGEYGVPISAHRNIRSEYASRLLSTGFRSPSSRYARIIDDIRNDVTRLAAILRNGCARDRYRPETAEESGVYYRYITQRTRQRIPPHHRQRGTHIQGA